MKRTNSTLVVARLMLIVLTLAITVFSFASCEGLPPELQEILGSMSNSSCEHVYDNACDTDCNTCGAARTTEHTYDNACDTDCNTCGAARTTEHTYDNACDTDCNTCGATRTTEHAYDNACDTDCNICGATRETEHAYDNACDTDCNTCGATRETEHAYDNACDTDCNACGATRETEHTYDNACDTDCNTCGATRETEHDYDNACDTDCNTCGATRETEHTYDNACDTDCNTCGATRTTEHDYVNDVCDVCGAINCKHTDVDYIPATAPRSCYDIGVRFDVYGCNDCGKGYSDAEFKNEIADLNDAIIPALGHIRVGDICERCGGILVGQGESAPRPDPTPWELACSQLTSLYRPDNEKATPFDYELVSKIDVEGEEFAVTWTIANESITLRYDETKGMYVVDIPDEITKNCYYSIEATINNSATGRSVKYLFVRLLEKNASTHQHPNVENCVCKDCNELVHNIEFAPAKAPTCTDFGNVEFYICVDCNKIFSDAEAKNEITQSVVVPAIGGEHNYVNGTCDKCGSSNHSSDEVNGAGNAPENPSEP